MKFVTKATSTMRAGLKEPAKSSAMKLEAFEYQASSWAKGVQGAKTKVVTVPSVVPK